MNKTLECNRAEVQFFTEHLRDTTYTRVDDIVRYPSTVLQEDSKIIEFTISEQDNVFLDLTSSILTMEFIVKDNDDNKKAVANSKVSPNNQLLYSRFQECYVYINDKLVFSERNYPYYCYLLNILNRNIHWVEDEGALCGFHLDNNDFEPANVTATNTTAAKLKSIGVTNRNQMAKDSKFKLCGPILAPIFNQQMLIPPGNNIRIRFVKGPSDFSAYDLRATADAVGFDCTPVKAKLNINAHTVNTRILEYYYTNFKTHNINYPVRHTEIRQFLIPSGATTYRTSTISAGLLPVLIHFVILEQEQISGDKKKFSFKFDPHNFESINVQVNGIDLIDNLPETDPSSGDYAEVYAQFKKHNGYYNNNQQISLIKHNQYTKGYFILSQNLTYSISPPEEHCLENDRYGKTEAVIKFSSGNARPLVLMAICNYNGIISLANDQQVITNFVP